MFRDMQKWKEIRHRVVREGVSIRQIQRETGLHFTTVKKVLTHSTPPPFRCGERAKPKIGPFLDRIAEILAAVKGRPFFVFHPSFGYFADDYGLEQIAVETGGAEPSARQLTALIEQARSSDVRVIFVQPQFSRKSAETIAAEIGGAVVPIDPLARDYVENLEKMARAVEEGLR